MVLTACNFPQFFKSEIVCSEFGSRLSAINRLLVGIINFSVNGPFKCINPATPSHHQLPVSKEIAKAITVTIIEDVIIELCVLWKNGLNTSIAAGLLIFAKIGCTIMDEAKATPNCVPT